MVDDAAEVNVQDRLHAAIAQALADVDPEEKGALVSRWVLAVERVHDKGSSCAYIASESMSTWEVIGMAEATSEMARAQLAYGGYEVDYDEDDEGEDA